MISCPHAGVGSGTSVSYIWHDQVPCVGGEGRALPGWLFPPPPGSLKEQGTEAG